MGANPTWHVGGFRAGSVTDSVSNTIPWTQKKSFFQKKQHLCMHETAISYNHSAILDPHKLRAKLFIVDIEMWNTADDPRDGNSSLYNDLVLSKSFLMLLFGLLLHKKEQQVSEEAIHSGLECNPLSSSSLLDCLSFTNNRSTHRHLVTETVLHFMSKDCMSYSVAWITILWVQDTQDYSNSCKFLIIRARISFWSTDRLLTCTKCVWREVIEEA